MAEVTSPSSGDTLSKVSANTATSVVAPPKFVFGSGMSERVKKSNDDDSDTSEKEDEQADSGIDFLEYTSSAVKRSADSDDPTDFSRPDFSFIPKKMFKKEDSEPKGGSVLRPSALSAIASKLASNQQCESDDKNNRSIEQDDNTAKTRGESSNSSSSSDSITSLSRPHLIDTPASLNTGIQSENYFQQFLLGNSSPSTSESKGSFVFGQNIKERVNVETPSEDVAGAPSDGSTQGNSPKSLADLAGKGNETTVETDQPENSIAAAAQKYEIEHSPPKQNLGEVQVTTGEEDERNVLQINCRLFIYCTETHSWLGRGRVILKLNDHSEFNSEGTFHSRLVARTQGNLRLVLNTKLWPEMVIEKASDKAIRVSAMEDDHIQLYLVMAPAREALQLYTAIDRRIVALKREQLSKKETDDEVQESTETTESASEEKDHNDEDVKDKNEKEIPNAEAQTDNPNKNTDDI